MDVPFVYSDFWLPHSGKCCWTSPSAQVFLHLHEPRGKYVLFIFFHPAFVLSKFSSHFWLPFDWIVTESHIRRYDCRAHNFGLMSNTAKFVEHSCSFLGFASNYSKYCFEVLKRYPEHWKSIFGQITLLLAAQLLPDQDKNLWHLQSLRFVTSHSEDEIWPWPWCGSFLPQVSYQWPWHIQAGIQNRPPLKHCFTFLWNAAL